MTSNEHSDKLSPTKLALQKIRDLKQQLQEAHRERDEPIAIVSVACRFPRRSSTPELFWQSLMEGSDEVGEVPSDRWDLESYFDADPETPGKMYARQGVFLDDLDQMDPEFFGISPREATWVDPQQRLLMEVSWEALERAGWSADLIGEDTGLFIGWMHNDYQNESSDSLLNLNPYIATGSAGSFLSGRLSYYLGLQGPSVAIDTACSSSLVALHLACQSLQGGECDRALVGGVNAIVSPTTNILTCKLKALSPAGHSRAFDAQADGYLRGEGCGVIALRRLADAERDGDPILAVIRGSAIGHNGFSSGLTAPNPKAQTRVIQQALARAGVDPADIAYLEAHGTGTELGDPIEMQAAAAALCSGRPADRPLLVGSVKTNIGHLEAAAGIAGLIKVVLSFERGTLPGQLNFEKPNPHIPWDRLAVEVLTGPVAWPTSDRRIAGVSAFGMSGTNAHVVVEAPPAAPRLAQDPGKEQEAQRPQLLVLSGKSEEAVHALADGYRDWFKEHPSADLSDVAYTAGNGRRHFEQRAALVASSCEQAGQLLEKLQRSSTDAQLFMGRSRQTPKIAWQFTGQGSQYAGLAKGLYGANREFREFIDECEAVLREERSGSLVQALFEDEQLIHHTSWTQPCLFAVQVGLARLLFSWGLRPDVVLGHSVGQYAAAYVAGVFDWEAGLRLISARGKAIGDLPSGGAMVAVVAPDQEVATAIENIDGVSIAAFNGNHTVISGVSEEVDRVSEQFRERGIRCTRLQTSHAFHSELMDPALAGFGAAAASLSFSPPQLPLICNLTGQVLPPDAELNGDYWVQHVRQPVQYARSLDAIEKLKCSVLMEIGPQPVLSRMATATLGGSDISIFGTLRNGEDDQVRLLSAVAELYVHGATPDFSALNGNGPGHKLVLPTYPFQRRRFWGPPTPQAEHAAKHTEHPLLGGQRLLAAMPKESRFESWISAEEPSWLTDHRVVDDVVVPGAAFVELALAAAPKGELRSLSFERPLRVTRRTRLQTVVRTDEEQKKSIELYALADGTSHWNRHFSASSPPASQEVPAPQKLDELRDRCNSSVDVEAFYQMMDGLGLHYGPRFQAIQELSVNETEVLALIESEDDLRGYTISPIVLDAAFHSLAVGLMRDAEAQLFLPTGCDRVVCYRPAGSRIWCHANWTQPTGEVRSADITLLDDNGEVIARIDGMQTRQLDRSALRKMSGRGADRLLYECDWIPSRLPPASSKQSEWLIVRLAAPSEPESSAGRGLAADIVEQLQKHGQRTLELRLNPQGAETEFGADTIALTTGSATEWKQVFDHLSDSGWQLKSLGIVWLLSDGAPSNEPLWIQTQAHVTGFLGLMSQLRELGIKRLERGLQLLTSGAVSTADNDTLTPTQSQYWGLGRVVAAEQPELQCRLIDVAVNEGDDSTSLTTAVTDVLLNDTRENQLAIRGGRLFAPRLKPLRLPPPAEGSTSPQIREDASYLIAGGLGMLGRLAARWLAAAGARHIVLVSRRPPTESALELIAEIESEGCKVYVRQADLGVEEQVAQLFAWMDSELPALGGLIHAAGVVDDGLIADQSWERFAGVASSKSQAAWSLHKLTEDRELDFFVLYSSAASVLGSPGQSNYATANGFLDGLAWMRRQMGLPALSVNWGPWTEGMADNEVVTKRLALQGITPLAVDESHDVLARMIGAETIQATVFDVDWRRMGMAGESPPLLENVTPSRAGRSLAGDSELVGKLKGLSGSARQKLLVSTLQSELQEVLSAAESPDVETPLIEMGLDSLMAVEFSTRLQQRLGDEFAIAPTLLFDYPTVTAISGYLNEQLDQLAGNEESAPQVLEVSPRTVSRDEVVIIGMSCRFPGANNPGEYWSNLLNGVDSVREIPAGRWDIEKYYSPEPTPGKMYTREGGFLDDVAQFDANFFNITGQEACWIDPQHRLLLEVSWEAMEDAGVPTQPLPDSKVGVFMGIMSQDYAQLHSVGDIEVIDGFQGAGLSHSAGVGRISYLFGFEGPSIAIDSASSSSLVAVCQAAKSLLEGDCNLALAGGVNAILVPTNSLLLSKAGMLSPDGRCKSFSAGANGFGRGEGCGVVILKRRQDAERDGDRILAVIRGAAVSHNGFSGGLTSPSGRSQERVIREALEDAQLQGRDVEYLEAHGTGTELGDPIEIRAAAAVLGKGRPSEKPLLVGSAKANIGHLEAAGGISGLIKTVLAMQHGTIPGQLHFDEPSPHVPWGKLPLEIVQEARTWPETTERIAGVSALGMSGTNAHVVLSRPASEQNGSHDNEGSPDPVDRLLFLSARSKSGLKELASKYRQHLAANSPDLDAFTYTAACGRRHFEHRAAMVIGDQQAAEQSLMAIEHGQTSDGVCIGEGARSPRVAWLFHADDHWSLNANGLEKFEVFRSAIADCEAAVTGSNGNREPGWLWQAMLADSPAEPTTSSLRSFALHAGLAALWRSWGIEPDAVLGIGLGQFAAAAVSGVMSMADAARLVMAREQALAPALAADASRQPSPSGTISSLDDFESFADTVDYFPCDRPLICNLSAEVVPVHRLLGGSYWRRHCSEPERTADSLQVLAEMKCDAVLEIGPRPMLPADEVDASSASLHVAVLDGERDDLPAALHGLAKLYVRGFSPDFAALYEGRRPQKVGLPTYPFERSRYWISDVGSHLGQEQQR